MGQFEDQVRLPPIVAPKLSCECSGVFCLSGKTALRQFQLSYAREARSSFESLPKSVEFLRLLGSPIQSKAHRRIVGGDAQGGKRGAR